MPAIWGQRIELKSDYEPRPQKEKLPRPHRKKRGYTGPHINLEDRMKAKSHGWHCKFHLTVSITLYSTSSTLRGESNITAGTSWKLYSTIHFGQNVRPYTSARWRISKPFLVKFIPGLEAWAFTRQHQHYLLFTTPGDWLMWNGYYYSQAVPPGCPSSVYVPNVITTISLTLRISILQVLKVWRWEQPKNNATPIHAQAEAHCEGFSFYLWGA